MLASGSVAAPVQLLGVDIFGSDDIAQNFISLSQMQTIKDKEEKFFLAKGVADRLSVQAGDEVVLIVPKTTPSDYGQSVPKIISINIGGVFSTQTSLDQKLILGPLSKVTTIVGLTNPQGVRIKLVDIFNSRDTGFRLLRNLPDSYYFSDWIQTHGNLYQAIKMSKKMVILLVFFIIAVAVFNVVSMLMMTVKDKRFDIAVLKTQGARNSDIAIIFLTQGFLIGSTGSLIGAFLGIMCALNAPLVINKIESIFEFNLLDSNVYPIDYLPSDLYMNDVVMIVLVAISLNLLVTIYPSCKAAKLNVSNELKHY
jgi:lipoprotein-releasing system permease protein